MLPLIDLAELGRIVCLFQVVSTFASAYQFEAPYSSQYPSYSFDKEMLPRSRACPHESTPAGNKCIAVFRKNVSWDEAKYACQRQHMKLLEIRSGDDYVQLRRALLKFSLGLNSYWVGIRSYSRRYQYESDRTSNGLSAAFWGPYFDNRDTLREPQIPDGIRDRCAFLSGRLYQYHITEFCTARKSFICEHPQITTPPRQYYGPYAPINEYGHYGSYALKNDYGIYGGPVDQIEPVIGPNLIAGTPFCEEGYVTVDGENDCYKVSGPGEELSYLDAVRKCQTFGGNLLKLKNMLQNEFLSKILDKMRYTAERQLYWVDRNIPFKRSLYHPTIAGDSCTSVWIQPLFLSQMNNQVHTTKTVCSLELRYICSKSGIFT